ncbi:PmoA family protein [Planctomicrobium sp. SH664]|uniref:DUF6807 domain-containing protein n=1 Tax=Planctomicrobium sp. SH664 TaxID=3448125 RepID=UPI003F5BB087
MLHMLRALPVVCCILISHLCAEEFTLRAGTYERKNCPVEASLPESLANAAALQLRDLESGQLIPVQLVEKGKAAFLLGELAAQGTRRYDLRAAPAGAESFPNRVTVQEQGGTLRMEIDGRPALSYHIDVVPAPAEADPRYRRSGHIHPVFTPQGKLVTDEMPPDHYHQHALFNAWVNTTYDGEHVDFWNQAKGEGTVEHREVLGMTSGPVLGSFQCRLAAIQFLKEGAPRDILDEVWSVTGWATGEGHLFEISFVQKNITPLPLRIEEYHYGGMAARGNWVWRRQPGFDFLTSEGKNRSTGNHTRPNWILMHGLVDEQPAGLAVFSHPGNFRSPQPVRIHDKMPYFVFSPPVLGAFDIAPGATYSGRYLYLANDGPFDADRLASIWKDYAEPPQIEWTP